MVQMTRLLQQRKGLIFISVIQRQNFAGVCIIMVTIAICFLTEEISISLKPITKMSA